MSLARQTCSEAFWAVSGTPTKHALTAIPSTDDTAPAPVAWTAEGMQDLKHLLDIMTHLLQMQPFNAKGAGPENKSHALVLKPVSGKDGPLYGAVERIEGLIQSVMIRTRSICLHIHPSGPKLMFPPFPRERDIEAEVTLPPCHERKQGLDLDYYGNLTYNVLQCEIMVCAISHFRVLIMETCSDDYGERHRF
jgi:hypothetical protein